MHAHAPPRASQPPTLHRTPPLHRRCCRAPCAAAAPRRAAPLAPRIAAAAAAAAAAPQGADAPLSADDLAPAGCERIKVALKKPLGLVLESNKAGDIFVVEVMPDGSAAKDGRICAGDQLIATSAVVYTSEDDYGGVTVKTGQQRVRLLVKGEKFDTGARSATRACVRVCAPCVLRRARLCRRAHASAALTLGLARSHVRHRHAPGQHARDAGHPEVQDAQAAGGGAVAPHALDSAP
jgi:hypothetical protein